MDNKLCKNLQPNLKKLQDSLTHFINSSNNNNFKALFGTEKKYLQNSACMHYLLIEYK